MRRPAPLPEELRGRTFTVREAAALGVHPERLRRTDLERPAPGIRMPALIPSTGVGDTTVTPWNLARIHHLHRARAESVRMSPDAAYSHVTAAVMLGFPLSTSRVRASPVHVTTAGDGARRFRMGVMNHPLKKDLRRRVERYGVSITHPVDTWCALSALLTVDELIEIGDHLVRRQNPDAAMSDLADAVARYAGRHGAKRLREALAEVRPRTDSVTETRLRLSIVRAGLPEPEINGAITDGEGRHIRLSDMVYREYMVFAEYDGEQHRTDAAQYAKDADALDRAIAAGWLPVRVRKAMLRDPDAAVRRVRAALRLRGWPGLHQR